MHDVILIAVTVMMILMVIYGVMSMSSVKSESHDTLKSRCLAEADTPQQTQYCMRFFK